MGLTEKSIVSVGDGSGALSVGSTDKKQGVQSEVIDLESVSSSEKLFYHVFRDPQVADHFRKIYEEHDYECRHLFDPDLTWTPEEERKITRKNDWHVTFWALIMFTALNFDRSNLNQALSDNFLEDIGINTNQLNTGNTLNLICFLIAELPSQLISKKLGADVWIPTQMCLWSAVTMSQFGLKNVHRFYATRALLGLFQGGFICDVCLWISYFFDSKEFPLRLSIFYISNPMTTVWSSLLAFALLKIKTEAHPDGWRWLFIVEGIFTFLVGAMSFFMMPASVVQTKTWYRKKGWYTDREEKILVNKILRDDPQKGDMHNREPVGPKELLKTLADYDLLPIYLVRLLIDIGTSPVSNYLQLTLRKMGFSTFKTNALTIPYNIGTVITMFAVNYVAKFTKSSSTGLICIPIWIAVGLLALRYWPRAQKDVWGTYALLTVLLSHPPSWPLTISWCSSNSNSVRTRAVSAAVVNIFSQTAAIIGANIYRKDDAPLYKRGNTDLYGIAFGAIGICLFARFYYPFRNRQKEAKWSKFSQEEKEQYVLTTTDDGNKKLNFRFEH